MGPPGAIWVVLERGVLEAFLFVLVLLFWVYAVRIVGAAGEKHSNWIHRSPHE